MGFTLNEYSLAARRRDQPVARKTEEEIYAKLKLDYIPPELRENLGEIEAAANHTLPELMELSDIRGDVHMHTVETDGRNTIEEMAEAARERGYEYMAITDHSKNLAFANGLTDERALAHIERIRADWKEDEGAFVFLPESRSTFWGWLARPLRLRARTDGYRDRQRSFALQSGSHATMTERLLKAISNPNTSLLGHPTGRQLLRRDAFQFDLDAVLKAAAKDKVAMELNSYPERLDLKRRSSAAGQTTWREDRHQHRFPPHLAHGKTAITESRRRGAHGLQR
jgi:DNA polymerase (family 10)